MPPANRTTDFADALPAQRVGERRGQCCELDQLAFLKLCVRNNRAVPGRDRPLSPWSVRLWGAVVAAPMFGTGPLRSFAVPTSREGGILGVRRWHRGQRSVAVRRGQRRVDPG